MAEKIIPMPPLSVEERKKRGAGLDRAKLAEHIALVRLLLAYMDTQSKEPPNELDEFVHIQTGISLRQNFDRINCGNKLAEMRIEDLEKLANSLQLKK
jgi:hypothetical protein